MPWHVRVKLLPAPFHPHRQWSLLGCIEKMISKVLAGGGNMVHSGQREVSDAGRYVKLQAPRRAFPRALRTGEPNNPGNLRNVAEHHMRDTIASATQQLS